MKLEEGLRLSARILEVIQPFCERVKVAGSIRRRRPEVRDVDLVLIPEPFMWPGKILGAVKENFKGFEVVRQGPKIGTVKVEGESVGLTRGSIDFNIASRKTWGVLFFIKTGSTEHNIRMCSRARRMGMQLSVARGLLRGGKVIASEREEEILRALGLPWIPPEEREVSYV